jgi:hypothetical protein
MECTMIASPVIPQYVLERINRQIYSRRNWPQELIKEFVEKLDPDIQYWGWKQFNFIHVLQNKATVRDDRGRNFYYMKYINNVNLSNSKRKWAEDIWNELRRKASPLNRGGPPRDHVLDRRSSDQRLMSGLKRLKVTSVS